MGEKLTKADIQKIQEEIDHRKIDLRPQLAAAVRDAADMDLIFRILKEGL